jgi:hypothetical protein
MTQQKDDGSGWRIAIAGAAGALPGTVIAGAFNYFDHKGDVDEKMIELSIGILGAKP